MSNPRRGSDATQKIVDAALDESTPLILIALSHAEGPLVDRGYAITTHPHEQQVTEDSWTLRVASRDGKPYRVGIWLDERHDIENEIVHITPTLRMISGPDATVHIEVRYTDDADASLWVDASDTHELHHALTTFRQHLAERVGHALDHFHRHP